MSSYFSAAHIISNGTNIHVLANVCPSTCDYNDDGNIDANDWVNVCLDTDLAIVDDSNCSDLTTSKQFATFVNVETTDSTHTVPAAAPAPSGVETISVDLMGDVTSVNTSADEVITALTQFSIQ